MKLRILGNSIRLRLSQTEVNDILQSKDIICKTNFPGAKASFIYSLELYEEEEIMLFCQDNSITVRVGEKWTKNWAASEEVGFEKSWKLPHGEQVKLIVEKDFQCLTERSGEDESDLFPNPNAKHEGIL